MAVAIGVTSPRSSSQSRDAASGGEVPVSPNSLNRSPGADPDPQIVLDCPDRGKSANEAGPHPAAPYVVE